MAQGPSLKKKKRMCHFNKLYFKLLMGVVCQNGVWFGKSGCGLGCS